MNTLHFIAKGTNYVNTLISIKDLVKDNFDLVIHTDETDRVKKHFKNADVREYNEHIFRYFDKYTLTYQVTVEKQKPVMYIDIGRISVTFMTNLPDFDENKISELYIPQHWGSVRTAKDLIGIRMPYFEDGYWDNVLDYFKKTIKLQRIVPSLERVFVMPYSTDMQKVIKELEDIRELFENNSKSKQHVYKGIGNGEGLALGYALAKLNIKSHDLLRLPIKTKSTI